MNKQELRHFEKRQNLACRMIKQLEQAGKLTEDQVVDYTGQVVWNRFLTPELLEEIIAELDTIRMNTDEPRMVYFIMETERTPQGEFIPCIAVEGEKGFHRTDWAWGNDKELAQKLCDQHNDDMGIDRKEAMKIQLRTMF